MNEDKIKRLLDKYFAGESTLEEEQEIQHFFAAGHIPPSLEVYRPMFSFFAVERAVEPPAKSGRVYMTWLTVAGIAAGLALMLIMTWPKAQAEQYVYYIDGQRVYDESAALQSAEDKLQRMSLSMQKAKNSLSVLEKVQNSTQPLQQINKMQQAYQAAEEILNIK